MSNKNKSINIMVNGQSVSNINLKTINNMFNDMTVIDRSTHLTSSNKYNVLKDYFEKSNCPEYILHVKHDLITIAYDIFINHNHHKYKNKLNNIDIYELVDIYLSLHKLLLQSKEYADIIIKKNPNNRIALFSLGFYNHYILKNTKIAMQYYKKSIKQNESRAAIALAILHKQLKNHQKVMKYYEMAINMKSVVAASEYSNYLILMRHSDTLKYIQLAYNQHKNGKSTYNYAFYCHFISHDYENAEKYYCESIEYNCADAINSYGIYCETIKQDNKMAKSLYKRSIKLDNKNSCCNL